MDGVEIRAFPNLSAWGARQLRAYFPPRYFFEFNRSVREFDLVHIHEFRHFLGAWAAHSAKKAGRPVFLSAHGTFDNDMQRIFLKDMFDLLLGRRTLTKIDLFHALTEQERAFMIDFGVSDEQIAVIPNGVELADLPGEEEQGRAREKWGFGRDDCVVLFMARLHKEKGLDTLLRALAKTDSTKLKLIAAGADDGVLESSLAFVKEHNLKDRVFFPGFLAGDEKRSALAAADIYVSLSNYETMPVSVLEGMAYAKPVLVSDAVAAVVQGLNHGEQGFVAEAGNSEEAAKALEQLADDKGSCNRMGKAGRKLVEEVYNWDRIAAAYMEEYERLLKK
jgi:glycosyltransferase involved in cell wall biosynthesis